MENKEIMEKLLDNSHSSTKSEKKNGGAYRNGEETSISRIRVITAKYKVYLVLLLIGICLLFLEYIPDMNDRYDSRWASYNQLQAQLVNLESQIKESEEEESFLYEIVENEDVLKDCLNEESEEECSLLPENWKKVTEEGEEYEGLVEEEELDKYNYQVPRSYLQLHSLHSVKMLVDEKMVLRNIDNYLIKENLTGTSKTSRVGDILSISIGEPDLVEGASQNFFKVPVNVTIKFVTIDDLIGFLYNVERKIIDTGEDRILYKIQTVSYDIISNDEPQITNIGMIAYYYYDERFENIEDQIREFLHPTEEDIEDIDVQVDENEEGEDNEGEDNEGEEEVLKSNESFLDKIFKK